MDHTISDKYAAEPWILQYLWKNGITIEKVNSSKCAQIEYKNESSFHKNNTNFNTKCMSKLNTSVLYPSVSMVPFSGEVDMQIKKNDTSKQLLNIPCASFISSKCKEQTIANYMWKRNTNIENVTNSTAVSLFKKNESKRHRLSSGKSEKPVKMHANDTPNLSNLRVILHRDSAIERLLMSSSKTVKCTKFTPGKHQEARRNEALFGHKFEEKTKKIRNWEFLPYLDECNETKSHTSPFKEMKNDSTGRVYPKESPAFVHVAVSSGSECQDPKDLNGMYLRKLKTSTLQTKTVQEEQTRRLGLLNPNAGKRQGKGRHRPIIDKEAECALVREKSREGKTNRGFGRQENDLNGSSLSVKIIHKCIFCDFTAENNRAFLKHLDVHRTKSFFHCLHCKYLTRLKKDFIIHSRIHTGEKPFGCDLCTYSARSKTKLNVHRRSHCRKKPYVCNFCGFKISCYKSFKIHISVHKNGAYKTVGTKKISSTKLHEKTINKPFGCHICPKKFHCRTKLKRHMETHLKIKKINCPLCLYKCRQFTAMRKHIERHEDATIRLLHCTFCNFKTTYAVNMMYHLKRHSSFYSPLVQSMKKFTCLICYKSYVKEDGLNVHMYLKHHTKVENVVEYEPNEGKDEMEKPGTNSSRSSKRKRMDEGSNKTCAVKEVKQGIENENIAANQTMPLEPQKPVQPHKMLKVFPHKNDKAKGLDHLQVIVKAPLPLQVQAQYRHSKSYSPMVQSIKKFTCVICYKSYVKEDNLNKHMHLEHHTKVENVIEYEPNEGKDEMEKPGTTSRSSKGKEKTQGFNKNSAVKGVKQDIEDENFATDQTKPLEHLKLVQTSRKLKVFRHKNEKAKGLDHLQVIVKAPLSLQVTDLYRAAQRIMRDFPPTSFNRPKILVKFLFKKYMYMFTDLAQTDEIKVPAVSQNCRRLQEGRVNLRISNGKIIDQTILLNNASVGSNEREHSLCSAQTEYSNVNTLHQPNGVDTKEKVETFLVSSESSEIIYPTTSKRYLQEPASLQMSNFFHKFKNINVGEEWNENQVKQNCLLNDSSVCTQMQYNYECSYCKFGTNRLFQFNLHLMVHSDENPLECSFCPTNFSNLADLKAHMKKHAKEELN